MVAQVQPNPKAECFHFEWMRAHIPNGVSLVEAIEREDPRFQPELKVAFTVFALHHSFGLPADNAARNLKALLQQEEDHVHPALYGGGTAADFAVWAIQHSLGVPESVASRNIQALVA